ncbi:MAG TPA: phosphoribosyl-ATP diphosphatase [Thermoanaerobacter sp.]|jgi:phosphoribosyl-ATP pyrophosphohydrolase/phosphoribosyl-AMP cyclohydrolase|nr:phosphoribosyl-ATP diphosphatase [Thermoanaerobacter sp.]
MEILKMLYERVKDRKTNPAEGSYTNYLFEKGIDKILKKIGEETTEVVIASKNDSKEEIVYEVSDLLYHLIVLLVDKGIKLEDVYGELGRRYYKPKEFKEEHKERKK